MRIAASIVTFITGMVLGVALLAGVGLFALEPQPEQAGESPTFQGGLIESQVGPQVALDATGLELRRKELELNKLEQDLQEQSRITVARNNHELQMKVMRDKVTLAVLTVLAGGVLLVLFLWALALIWISVRQCPRGRKAAQPAGARRP